MRVSSDALLPGKPTVLTVATVPDTDTPPPQFHVRPQISTDAEHVVATSNAAKAPPADSVFRTFLPIFMFTEI